MFYLIHWWQCSPWICIWIILFSWAQGLLIFILAPKYKQKSFCKNQRRHTRKLKQIFNTHLQLNINAIAAKSVEKPSLITTTDLRSLSDSIPSLVGEEVWVTDHFTSLSMFEWIPVTLQHKRKTPPTQATSSFGLSQDFYSRKLFNLSFKGFEGMKKTNLNPSPTANGGTLRMKSNQN